MIKENKTSKYLLYGIGEIILVVIGILIALQINNKNEAHNASIKERGVLIDLFQDLKSDSISYSRNIKTLTDINILHKKLYEIGINNKDSIIIENPNYIRRTLYYNPITKENDPFIASKISNDAVRKEILNYYRIMNDMDGANKEFEDVIHDRMRIFLGKKEMQNLSVWFETQNLDTENGIYQDFISQEDLMMISKTAEFQQLLLEASIKSNESLSTLKLLITQNNKLKNTIEKRLDK
jgi:Family of unknown function (DUF6090)